MLFTYASFSQCDIISQSLPNSLYNNVYSISSTYTYNTIYNYTTQYTNCAVYIYFPFHNVNIFPQLLHNWLYNNVYSISSTYTYGIVYNYTTQYTDFAVYICFLYTMWHFFTITAQLTLQQCLQHILNIYIRYCLQLHYPVHWLCCLYMLSFSQCDIFHNYCTIHYTTMFTAYPQHIHAVLLQLHYPVCWLFCLHMLSFSQCEYFSTLYCTIVYMTMFTFNLLCLHAVLFTITLHSILSVLFTYAVLFTMWYFSTITAQLTLQQCLQHILNTYIQYCSQLHYPVYWLCCLYMLPSHNVTFFHNYCTIDSTSMSTAYPQHIHKVLFATTPHSILALLFIYAFLFTMWYFSTMTAQFTLQQCLQHILNTYIQYCSQLHYPLYWLYCLDMLSFSQCDIFPQWLHNSLYNNVYSISSTYTYDIVYNYTIQYTDCAVYIYTFPSTMIMF